MNDPALIQAVGEVLDAFDQGVFVRSTCFDGRPDWAIKIVKPLASLAKLRQLYLEDETT